MLGMTEWLLSGGLEVARSSQLGGGHIRVGVFPLELLNHHMKGSDLN